MWNVECGTLYEIYSGTYHLPSISIYLRANTFSKQSGENNIKNPHRKKIKFVVLVVQYFIFISRSKYYDDATTSTHEDAKRDDDLSPVETKSTRFLIDIFVDRNAVRDHLNCNTNKSIISNSIKIKIVSTILLSASYQRVML
jgi:hypothetical protein